MVFSREHKVFMLESYFRNGTKINGVWTYSVGECIEEFRAEFPQFAFEYGCFRQTLSLCVKNFRENGSVGRKPGSGRPKERTPEVVENVQQIMEAAPSTSIRHLSQQVNLSVGTCSKILRKDIQLYPYRISTVQELHLNDFPQRLNFCRWFLDTLDNNLLEKTFFTDEAAFHLNGYVNSQNMRMWSSENPHFFMEASQYPQKVNVWAAISERRIIGPIFFEGNINAARYREEILTPFFDQLHDDELIYGFFQQDGATCHTTGATLDFLTEFYDDRIISRNTPHNWPPRSCDLTPCDFFLWPYIKNSIYQTPVNDLETLRGRIQDKINEINNNPIILSNFINGVKRRARLCLQEGGGHFQHLL